MEDDDENVKDDTDTSASSVAHSVRAPHDGRDVKLLTVTEQSPRVSSLYLLSTLRAVPTALCAAGVSCCSCC